MWMSNSINELEIKVAFLEDTLAKLSDEFYQQQRELDSLKAQYDGLINKVRTLGDNESASTDVLDERPPHY